MKNTIFLISVLFLPLLFCSCMKQERPAKTSSKSDGAEAFSEHLPPALIEGMKHVVFEKDFTGEDKSRGNLDVSLVEKIRGGFHGHSVYIKVEHANHIYEEGEKFRLSITSTLDGYLYLVSITKSGEVRVFYPNKYLEDNSVKAGNLVVFPPKNEKESGFKVQPPLGREMILAIVSQEKLSPKMLGIETFETDCGKPTREKFHQGIEELSKSNIERACNAITITSVPYGSPPPPKRRYVVLFGTEFYEHQRRLEACTNDMKLMNVLFKDFCKTEPPISIYGKELTKKKVEDVFMNLAMVSQPGDEIFIYWTGHGETISKTGTHILHVHDSKPEDATLAVTDDEFERWLDHLDGRRIILFFDACRSGAIIGDKQQLSKGFNFMANKFERPPAKEIRPEQAAVLCSSQAGEVSYVDSRMNFSIMTWLLAKRVAESETEIVFEDLCRHVAERVPKVAQSQGEKKAQTPVWMNQIGTIFVKP